MKFPILTAAVLMRSAALAQADSRPNIVFVFSDDHATQAISSYGGRLAEVAPTPNLDRIAEEGMRFTRCLVTNSICGPSRATILTGKYSHLNGFYKNEATKFDGSQQTFRSCCRRLGIKPQLLVSGTSQATRPALITGRFYRVKAATTTRIS